jgi:nocturnin
VLEVLWIQSNQVVKSVNLRERKRGKEICVATTHLKARSGTLLPTIRNEQGKDILEWLDVFSGERPLIISGDFNAEPSEPVYHTMVQDEKNKLQSAYNLMGNEREDNLEYTTWKIRETGEQKRILDYIFYSTQLESVSSLDMPTEEQIGEDRLPSLHFASDHLSLVAEIRFKLSSNQEKEANS